MDLLVQVTNLEGEVISTFKNFSDLRVDIPLNDSRTASVAVPIEDTLSLGLRGQHVTPADHMLKVLYVDFLVFWGQILNPVWNASDGRVVLQAHDPTIRLKHHYHRYGDFVVGSRRAGGYPVNGMGMKLLVTSAFPTDRQQSLGWPHPGIYFGIDRTTNFTGTAGPMPSWPRPTDLLNPEDGDALWRVVERGTNVWDSMQNVMQSVEGFDVEFEPIDADHPPRTNQVGSGEITEIPWQPGFYVQMNTYERQGVDRTASNRTVWGSGTPNVVMQYGFGRSDLADFIYRPDANAMRNYAGVHYPGGPVNPGDRKKMAHVWVQDSAERYGQYHEWATAGAKDSKKVMLAKAEAITAAYAFPPDFFEVVLLPEEIGSHPRPPATANQPYRYASHFFVGDTVTAQVKKGAMVKSLDGRITQVTLEQDGAAKRLRTRLTCVPRVLEDLDEITGEAN